MSEHWHVEVREGEGGLVLSYVFTELPISFGRHEGNDVRLLRPFVSGFHARVERGSAGLSVLDLDSTNGVRVRGEGGKEARIPSQEPHALSGCDHQFSIGVYRIQLQRSTASLAPARSEQLSLPALSSQGLSLPAVGQSRWDGSAGLGSAGLGSGLPSLPPSDRAQPSTARGRGEGSDRRDLEATALAELEQLARAVAPAQQLDTPEKVADLIRRLQLSLELSCRGLVRLRTGQRRCASVLRLPAIGRHGKLGVDSPEQLTRRVLDARLSLNELRTGLLAEFHALARHQVALLDGMIEGAGALLSELAPERVEARAESQGADWLPLVGKLRALRRAYREQHAQLSCKDGVLSLVFGRAFRDAYASYLNGVRPRQGSARRLGKLR